jgi:hypothetical protein
LWHDVFIDRRPASPHPGYLQKHSPTSHSPPSEHKQTGNHYFTGCRY